MPYLDQGMRLDEAGKVTAIWADSPASLAGLQPGDVIWGLDGEADQPQGRALLEPALENPAPGKHILSVVAAEDWGNGPPSRAVRNDHRLFNPKRRKVELLAP